MCLNNIIHTILGKEFKRLPPDEQKYIILSNQEFYYFSNIPASDKQQSLVIKMWVKDLYDSGVITYERISKNKFEVKKGKNFHLILMGIGASTVHSELPCGCEILFNEIIQQLLIVESHCDEHEPTYRSRRNDRT